MTHHYLIIGNGAAGLSAAEMIRQRDRLGRITILTNESHYFYSRPGIAYVINGQVSAEQIVSRSEQFYREHRLDLCFGHATELDLVRKTASLRSGETLHYDVLLLATGASATPPRFPGRELDGILTFDTLDDAQKVIRYGRRAKAAVVAGGGITAMELAEGLRHQGTQTHLLQRGQRIWPRLLDERESAIIEAQIRHEGIQIHYDAEIDEVLGKKGKVAAVRLKNGQELKAQVVGVAIGVRPNLELVKGLPVKLDQGVLVDEFMQSSVPGLFAAGDVAQVYDRWTDRHQLDILWPSAINEGRAAGYNMVDVARGERPRYAYQKGSPFNAALLFGVHLTVIGRVGIQPGRGDVTEVEEITHLSRGASQVWTTPFQSNYRSAWDSSGPNSLRIVVDEGRIVGALLLGNQELADPLRQLIEHEVNVRPFETLLLNGQQPLPKAIMKAWRDWHESWN